MGGHAAGDVASQIAVRHLASFAGAVAIDSESAVAACRAANAEILQRSRSNRDLAGMGTTVAGVALSRTADGDGVLVFNAGDSRIYRSLGNTMVQVSEDHSVVAELLAAKAISQAEARAHPHRNVVTRVLGVEDDVEIDTWVFEATTDSQRFLICSDGLTNELSDEEIHHLLGTERDPDACASALMAAALAHGARDNVSVVVVDVSSSLDAGTSLDAPTAPRSELLTPPSQAPAQDAAAEPDPAGLITDVPDFSRGSA
jgi:protein phosphatase